MITEHKAQTLGNKRNIGDSSCEAGLGIVLGFLTQKVSQPRPLTLTPRSPREAERRSVRARGCP